MDNNASLDSFVAGILDEKKYESISEERKNEMIAELKEMLLNQINRAILDALPDSTLDEINEKMDTENFDEAKMQEIIAKSGIDVAKITTETMIRFREFYLG